VDPAVENEIASAPGCLIGTKTTQLEVVLKP
jgi:hypothetical protein